MRISREFSFEAAHVLSNYNGACNNLHGHSYFGKIEIERSVKAMAAGDRVPDMLIDFNQLKKVITDVIMVWYDHSTIFAHAALRDDFERELYELCIRYHKKVATIAATGRSTCEMLCRNIAEDVAAACKNIFGDSDYAVRCYLHETAGSECISEWVHPKETGCYLL